jgi:hypothetical protein
MMMYGVSFVGGHGVPEGPIINGVSVVEGRGVSEVIKTGELAGVCGTMVWFPVPGCEIHPVVVRTQTMQKRMKSFVRFFDII